MSQRARTLLYIFDLDGTLVLPHSGDRFARDEHDWELLPGRLDRLWRLRHEGHVLTLASNQGGVSFGYLTAEQAGRYVERVARRVGAVHTQVCFHHPEGTVERYRLDCPYRKPQPGMLLALLHQADARPEEAVHVGDLYSDKQAAEAANVAFMWAYDFFAANGTNGQE